jgi:protein-S-isoprenylcysteine O-methyltransferase Ste14
VNVYLRTAVFVVFIPGSVAVYIPYFLLASNLEVATLNLGAVRYLGLIPLAFGLVTAGWSIWSFASKGKGSPAMHVDEPIHLVVTGFYHYVRNPIYVGITLILLGEATLFDSTTLIVYTVFWMLNFHVQVVYHEEPHLRKKFGTRYEEYLRTVPRWIPRRRRKTGPMN